MKHKVTVILLLAVSLALAVDLSTQKKIHETDDFQYFSEDSKDYSELIDLVEAKNREFKEIFNKVIPGKIKIYIFSNQLAFSKCVFGSDKPVQNATGFADHLKNIFYITSFYDTCKPKERLLQTPIHELVHIYFPSDTIWIREGIACLYADMLKPLKTADLPQAFSDLLFYGRGNDNKVKAYIAGGWIVKYIIEELCRNDMDKFRQFARHPENYHLIQIKNEADLFKNWREYMVITGHVI